MCGFGYSHHLHHLSCGLSFLICIGFVCRVQTMYQNKKFSTTSLMPQRSASQAPEPRGSSAAGASTNSAGSPGGGSGGGGSAAKQRLRWTPELHERFVDAVTQLGGPDRELFSCQLIHHPSEKLWKMKLRIILACF